MYRWSWNIARSSLRVLLDKSVPLGVRRCLSQHTIDTVAAKGWSMLSNGNLFQAAENQIDVLVTCDQNIVHQQNLSKTTIAIVVVDTNLWPIIKAALAPIARAVDAAPRQLLGDKISETDSLS
jgi:hypothetical protein